VRNNAKIEICTEKLLQWAYIDELSKRQSSAAEGIWDHILDYSNHGGIDSGRGAAQRYAHFGLPDADAERIEQAVALLPDTVVDWSAHFADIAGDLAGLISINDLAPQLRASSSPKTGWGNAGTKALRAFFGDKGAQPLHDRPRDVLLVGAIKTNVLLTVHAVKGSRPEWRHDEPYPAMVPASKGTGPTIVGECRAKNLYTTGSYCPLNWSPSPLSIVMSRARYFAWHQGLTRLAATLSLDKFEALPPKAPRLPWVDDREAISRIIPVMPTGHNDVSEWGTLPLTPPRPRSGWPRRASAAV
jgi:hypothetical protein